MLEAWTVVLIVVGVVVWLALLIGVIWLRGWSKGRFEPKLPDAIIAALPILIVLVATGVIKLGINPQGEVTAEATTRTVILAASKQNVGGQVTKLPWTPIDVSPKGGLRDLPSVLAQHKAGLSFSLAQHGYKDDVIRGYLDALVNDPAFHYVIITNADAHNSLFGLFDGRKLNDILKAGHPSNFNDFARALDNGEKETISSYSGFVSEKLAIMSSTPKDEALQKMENNNLEWLPVVDENHSIVGIVDRTRLIASLILDVTDKLKVAQGKPST